MYSRKSLHYLGHGGEVKGPNVSVQDGNTDISMRKTRSFSITKQETEKEGYSKPCIGFGHTVVMLCSILGSPI